MKTVKKLTYFFCITYVILGLPEIRAERPKIGMLLPLTGVYAAGGVDNRQGIEAAFALSNSAVDLEVIYADSKADPATGISESRKMINTDHVLGVFVMRGSVGMAVNSIYQSSKVPLFGAVGNKNFAIRNEYAFQVWSTSDEEGAFLANKLREEKNNKVALITVQDDWQDAVSDEFRATYRGSELAIVYDQEIVPSELDFRTHLSKINALTPDVIFANLGLSQMGPFLRQIRELNIKSKIYCNFWVAKKEVSEAVGAETLEGVRFVEMDTDLPTLVKAIAEKHAGAPSGSTLSAYAATLLINQVLSANPDIHTREYFYTALLKETEVKTPDGPIPIKDRRVKFPLVEKVIHKGKVEVNKSLERLAAKEQR